jgi:hypothetical protein
VLGKGVLCVICPSRVCLLGISRAMHVSMSAVVSLSRCPSLATLSVVMSPSLSVIIETKSKSKPDDAIDSLRATINSNQTGEILSTVRRNSILVHLYKESRCMQ